MNLAAFLILSFIVLLFAYRFVGRFLSRFLEIGDHRPTPAHTHRDGVDFEPASASYLLPQHFSAIAAAGPIVGPILAGISFGWLPTYLWIIFGAILVGGVHDLATLIASVRNQGRSVAELIRLAVGRRSYMLFLVFIWIALIYVIIAFTDVTSSAFVNHGQLTAATAPGPAVASSSVLYLLLSFAMGITIRFSGMTAGRAKMIFLPLVVLAIVSGPAIPLNLGELFSVSKPQVLWNYLLLAYCFVASLVPVWLLLQPRGDLGGYFLFIVILAGSVGILVGSVTGDLSIHAKAIAAAPLFATGAAGLQPIFPTLFITVACGACSGFHCIVASGTTSKQLAQESDAVPVAYGGMLLEAFFACISLATVMVLTTPDTKPDAIFARGIAQFISAGSFGLIRPEFAAHFALLCFATFIFDTLDACTRLARYVLVELTGWKGVRGMVMATLITLAFPMFVVSLPPAEVGGHPIPIWKMFWNLFGSSNQLLAAMALLAVSCWLAHLKKPYWLTLAPMLFMTAMTLWSLTVIIGGYVRSAAAGPTHILKHMEFAVASSLMLLAVWLIVESGWAIRKAGALGAEAGQKGD